MGKSMKRWESVTRVDPIAARVVQEHEAGLYVRHSDYIALLNELRMERARLKAAGEMVALLLAQPGPL